MRDGVIDFEAATRDKDNRHLSDAGYQAMADAVDLKLFSGKPGKG